MAAAGDVVDVVRVTAELTSGQCVPAREIDQNDRGMLPRRHVREIMGGGKLSVLAFEGDDVASSHGLSPHHYQ